MNAKGLQPDGVNLPPRKAVIQYAVYCSCNYTLNALRSQGLLSNPPAMEVFYNPFGIILNFFKSLLLS
ncbi:hypothetical protein D0B03_05620 [Campylobacter upsaliensis]|uniref:Uncharacterized protein n=1 Tax=Campylobacter upsaliensis TaxID=28080 RepID=A0A5L8Z9E0_CAMUP|nr:hypothetical protein [Campylobacter upsaliensis]